MEVLEAWRDFLPYALAACALMGAAFGRGRLGRPGYAARLLLGVGVIALASAYDPPETLALRPFPPEIWRDRVLEALTTAKAMAVCVLIGCLFAWSACRLNDIGVARWHALHAAAPLLLEPLFDIRIAQTVAFGFLGLYALTLTLAPSRAARDAEAAVETFR